VPAIDWTQWLSGLNAASSKVSVPDTRERLERARSLMHERFADAVDLEVLARQAFFSRYHFLREFRREFGITPHQYLVQRRLDAAKALLQSTDKSVTEVCFEVGYGSIGSFGTLFQRHVGVSPLRYRTQIFQVPDWIGPARMIPACFLGWGVPPRSSNIREARVEAPG
jgi:AraC-like DNA-binding protein